MVLAHPGEMSGEERREERRELRREVGRGEKWGETTTHHDEDIGPPSIFKALFRATLLFQKLFCQLLLKKNNKNTTPDTMISSEQLLTNQ